MGLDVVEMVMRVEEEFGIVIEDEEASYINTVGQLHTLILSKTGLLDSSRCPSCATFYQLRRSLITLAVAPRWTIRPATSVGELLPASRRRRMWKDWSASANIKLPSLEKPKWMGAVLWLAFGLAIGAGPFFWAASNLAVFSYYATAVILLVLLYKWSELHAIHLPADCASVGGVTKAVMKLNYGINIEWDKTQGQDEVWQKLITILVEQSGVEPDEITRDAEFVRDLHMD